MFWLNSCECIYDALYSYNTTEDGQTHNARIAIGPSLVNVNGTQTYEVISYMAGQISSRQYYNVTADGMMEYRSRHIRDDGTEDVQDYLPPAMFFPAAFSVGTTYHSEYTRTGTNASHNWTWTTAETSDRVVLGIETNTINGITYNTLSVLHANIWKDSSYGAWGSGVSTWWLAKNVGIAKSISSSIDNGALQNMTITELVQTNGPAQMISPPPSSTLTNATVTFTWDAGAGVSQYALWVGSASNTYDLYALAVGTNLSQTLTLPVDGRALYVRLWSLINGGWQYNDYSYKALTTVKARLAGLSNGATLSSTNVTLSWDAGAGASQYAVWVGTSPGSYDLYALATGTNLSQALTLPSDGRRLYVRVWSLINGTWKWNNYELTAYLAPASPTAQMLSPTNGVTLASTPVTFNWNSGTGATAYALWVGCVPSDYDLYALAVGTNRTQTLSVPMDGGSLCVRLWSLISGTWQWNDYTYGTTAGGVAVKAQMVTPGGGATLTNATTTFSWNGGTGVSQYALWAGSAPASYDLYALAVGTNLTQTVTLPADGGPIYMRLWSLMSGAWKFNDYFYMAFLAP